jgi:two-component system sensor histidine kinase AlgZ
VQVRGRVEPDGTTVVIEVANPVHRSEREPRRGHRMALDNVRERLELAFPGQASVEVQDASQSYCVRLRFPCVGEKPHARIAADLPSSQ